MLKRFCLFSKKFSILSKPPPNLSSSEWLVTNLSPVWGPTRLDETSPVKKTNFFICRFLRVSKLKLTVLERDKIEVLVSKFYFNFKERAKFGGFCSSASNWTNLKNKTSSLLQGASSASKSVPYRYHRQSYNSWGLCALVRSNYSKPRKILSVLFSK